MGKFGPRLKGKGKRWAKGQSSSSNPETKKFRNSAKSLFFQPNVGTSSSLTVEALKKLNAFNDGKVQPSKLSIASEVSDEESVITGTTFKTFQTFASDWSMCSNQSFSKLINNFKFDSAHQKEMLAVLAAVTEVIKANGGKETTTEYFGALMLTLDISETEESVAAIVNLLGMGIKAVPQEVLRLKFSECSKTFMDLLTKFCDSDNNALLRGLLGCLSVVLRSQDLSVWSNSSTVQVFHSLLAFTTHSKPKIRKAAQHAVCAVLKGSSLIPDHQTHPGAAHAAKFCSQAIESGGKLGGTTTTLHVLILLKEILSTFPKSQLKGTCETILKIMTLGNALVTSCSLQALHGLFICRPPVSRLPAELNAQLFNALYDYQPSINDAQPTIAWLTVMQEALCNLSRINADLCTVNLPKFFTTVSNYWLCDNSTVINSATLTLRSVAMECLQNCKTSKHFLSASQKCFSVVENGLTYQYHNAWAHVLSILATLFESIGGDGKVFMSKCLKSMVDLRETYQFTYSNELDFAIGKAVRTLGPEFVLEASPFLVTGQEQNNEFKKSWMLPILKDNVQKSSLKFFIQYFLPLATLCRDRSSQLSSANDKVGSHCYHLLMCQIWSLLPSFCNEPTDIKESFKGLAKSIGYIISDVKDLRLPVMSALRKLINCSQDKHNIDDIGELKRFAKNFLPILFSVYTIKPQGSDEEGQRLAVLETVKIYLTIAPDDLTGELFDKAFLRLNTPDLEPFLKESIMDLLKVLLPYQDDSRLSLLYSKALEFIRETKNKKDQKKSYRLLEELCKAETDNCKMFIVQHSTELLTILVKALNESNISSKGPRLRCLLYLVRLLPKSQYHVIKTIVPEAVLCCKDINEKCRACAYQLLEEMLVISQKWGDKTDDDIVRDYFGLMLGGLAGPPNVASATILAMTKLTHTLRLQLPPDLIELLIENISLLNVLPTREIVGSCLSFIKLFITSFKTDLVLPFLPTLVKCIVSMTDDCKRHFRLKTRDILDRLIRKYSYETVSALVPQKDTVMHKRLSNLRKINARKKKLKDEAESDEEEDYKSEFSVKNKPKSIEEILASSDESEDDVDMKSVKSQKNKKNKKKSNTFIQEEGDEIVDLMSPQATSKISTTRPGESMSLSKPNKGKDRGFKTAPDGRLIITDLSDDENKSKKSNKLKLNSDTEDDYDSDEDTKSVQSRLSQINIGRKRKFSTSTSGEPPLKYQAGGSGIHRPIGTEKQKTKKNKGGLKTGEEYRAKKAQGDVKVKGKPDPYAYLPLSRKMLNRRKRQKQSKQFKTIVSSAKKGAKIGSKLKSKRRK